MIFQHTHELVLSGQKTQTRRLAKVKPKNITVGTYYDFEILTADPVWFEDGTVEEFDKRVITIYTRQPGWIHADYCIEPDEDTTRIKWQVGRTYAVQPGRTLKSVGRIRITSIECEDVRNISAEDARAEGFESKQQFMLTWLAMHDKPTLAFYKNWILPMGFDSPVAYIQSRPAERYQAWKLTFELVKE